MKNLKKILSLVLALAMALSLMTVAFAADAGDFTDYGDVTYTEAVDVMTAVGVFNGTGSGNSFDPNGTLTREQAAKIITYMIMGQTQADKLVATIAPFADVSADRWSAGAIAYCASEGIMNGTGNGKFSPTGELTGLQFAKMLLVALGYDAEIEKMTGAAWGLATSKLAYAVELDDGLGDINLTAPMTREQAAQMAFTTMKTPLVEYGDKGTTISVNGAVVEFGAQKAEYVTVEKTDGTNNATKIDDAQLANGWIMIEFGERYCKDLEKTSTTNSLAQPVRKWTYKNDTIGKYAIGEEKVVVVADKDKTLDDILTGKSYMNYSSSDLSAVRVNDGTDESPVYSYNAFLNGDQLTSSYRTTLLHKGDVVYAYENSAGKVNKVVIARYTLAKIDSVTDKLNANETEAGADYRVKLVDLSDSSIHNSNYYNDHSNSNYIINGFASGTYTEGTILAVAVNPDGGEIADSYVAEIVTGKPTAVKENDGGDITIDGTRYPFIARKDNAAIIPDGETNGFDFDNEYAVYTTKEGYVIGIEGVTSANVDNLYYVTGIYVKASSFGEDNKEYYAQRVSLADGSTDTVRVEKGSVQVIYNDKTLTANSTHNNNGATVGDCTSGVICDNITHAACTQYAGLYTFNDKRVAPTAVSGGNSDEQKAGNDILSMVAFADDSVITKDFSATQNNSGKVGDANVDGTVDVDATRLPVENANGTSNDRTFYLNAETKFIAVEAKGSDIDVSYSVGSMKVSTVDAPVIVVYNKDDARTAIAVIYAADTLNVSTFTKDVVYLAEQPTRKNSNDTWEATLYEMNDGGKTTREVRLDSNYPQGFYQFSENSDGSLKLTEVTYLDDAMNPGLTAAYDDETGAILDVTINDVYKTNLFSANTTHIQNVNFNGVTIIDNRAASDMLDDDYTTAITSVGDLKRATDDGCIVTADVYFDKGATFIAVDGAVKNATANVAIQWQADGTAGGSQAASAPGAVAVGPIDNGVTSVVLTVTNTSTQRVAAVGGTVTGGNAANATVTVNTTDIATTGGTKDVTITVSETGKSDITYTVTITVAEGDTPLDADITASDLQTTLNAPAAAGKTFTLTPDGGTLALGSTEVTVPAGVTLKVDGAVTADAGKLVVNGTLEADSATYVKEIGANGTLKTSGTVGTVAEMKGGMLDATGGTTEVTAITTDDATIKGDVGTIGTVNAPGKTVTIQGDVTTKITTVTAGTITTNGDVAKIDNLNGGTVTLTGTGKAIAEIENVTGAENNTAIAVTGKVTKLTQVTKGALTITGDVDEVTDIAATNTPTVAITGTVADIKDNHSTLTVTGNVTKLTDNNGTLTVNGNITGDVVAISASSTLNLSGTATIDGTTTTTLAAGTIALGANATLTISGTIDVSAVTFNATADGAKITIAAGASVTAATGNKIYAAAGTTASTSPAAGTYTYGDVTGAAAGTKGFVGE